MLFIESSVFRCLPEITNQKNNHKSTLSSKMITTMISEFPIMQWHQKQKTFEKVWRRKMIFSNWFIINLMMMIQPEDQKKNKLNKKQIFVHNQHLFQTRLIAKFRSSLNIPQTKTKNKKHCLFVNEKCKFQQHYTFLLLKNEWMIK